MKLFRNTKGAMGTKALIILVVLFVVAILLLSGMIHVDLPGVQKDNINEQTVIRKPSDLGILVPINVQYTYFQDRISGENKVTIEIKFQHRNEGLGSDGNIVPDPTIVTRTNFDSTVGNVDDTTTIYVVNGDSFVSSNIAYNGIASSVSGATFGVAQKNYKVFTKSSTYQPPASNPTKDNHAIMIQTVWKHYRKGTNELLNSNVVTFLMYCEMPSYGVDHFWSSTEKYQVFVPFDDFAFVEDIKWDVLGYLEKGQIEWRNVEAVTHTYWDFPILNTLFPGSNLKLVQSRDVSIPTRIQYSWEIPKPFDIDNDEDKGSHRYVYKIR